MSYTISCIHEDRADWVGGLRDAVADEVRTIGGAPAWATVRVVDGLAPADGPHVVVYLGSAAGRAAPRCEDEIREALRRGLFVLPCVTELAGFRAATPDALHAYNGFAWGAQGAGPPRRLVRVLFEQLGLEEKQRRVFISHRRDDSMAMAEQLHDKLVKHGFEPFVDRWGIAPAADVQLRIYEALEDAAFVLFLESENAAASEWVLKEVHYALRHTLGMLIATFPGVAQTLGTAHFPCIQLDGDALVPGPGGRVLDAAALDLVVDRVEEIHAGALVRRRRRLVTHTRHAAEREGYAVREEPGPVLVAAPGPSSSEIRDTVVGFTSRLPRPTDLHDLDVRRADHAPAGRALLVHAAEAISGPRRALLEWCAADRPLTLSPDNAVAGYWG